MSSPAASVKMPATPPQMRWALLALAAAILPFLFSLPPWVAGAALGIVGWRLLALTDIGVNRVSFCGWH